MNLYGANPDELDHLGTTLKRQIDSIQSVLSSVGGVLGGTKWMGPARDRFQHDWDHGVRHQPRCGRLRG